MITDKSRIPRVGINLLRKNLPVLSPPRKIALELRNGVQVLSVEGPKESYESISFTWGRPGDRSHALAEALDLLGHPLSVEQIEKLDPNKEVSMA